MSTMQQIPVSMIQPHPRNPRKQLGDLTELTDSIRAQGIRQNLLLVPHGDEAYRCVIGHRRLAAAKAAGLDTVPAVIDDSLTEAQQLELMLVENLQRVDLTPIEEAHGYQDMLDLGFTVRQVATQTGRSQTTIRARVDLLTLPENAQTAVGEGQGSLEDAAALLEFQDDPDTLEQLVTLLGTRNFHWRLANAREDRERRAEQARQIAEWEARGAVEYTGPTTVWGSPENHRVIHPGDGEDLPEGTVWCRQGYHLQLYVPSPPSARDDSEKAAKEAARAEKDRQDAQDTADAATAWTLRDAFVDTLLARKLTVREKDLVAALVVLVLGNRYMSLQTDVSLSPHHQLIALCHGWHDDNRWDWRDLRSGRGTLLDWYDTLGALGYVASTVEEAAIAAGSDAREEAAADDMDG